jgi:UDP:flavonoid glycosyltransferase YjiC (YdhE family)
VFGRLLTLPLLLLLLQLSLQLHTQIVLAVNASNARVLIQSSWSALKGENIPDTVFQLGPAPHDWLLPRMAAVVHHGYVHC